MIKYLRLYHFELKSNRIVQVSPGEILSSKKEICIDNKNKNIKSYDANKTTLYMPSEVSTFMPEDNIMDNNIQIFFNGHTNNLLEDDSTQNFRFKNEYAEILSHSIECFNGYNDFKRHSALIASKFKSSMSANIKNNFYLIIYVIENKSDSGLVVMKMNAGMGVQVNKGSLKTLSNMLPDIKSRLQKAAYIYKKNAEDFRDKKEKGEERKNIHSKILDRQDNSISGYFFNSFLDSKRVIDNPNITANLAIKSITSVSENYLKDGFTIDDVKAKLEEDLSIKKNTSYNSLVNLVSDMYDKEKMNKKNKDYESISEDAFLVAKNENSTVIKSFTAQVSRPPKVKITDIEEQGRLNISYYKSLETSGDVILDTNTKGDYNVLKISKDIFKKVN